MASYYYLMASLPMLRSDGAPPIDYPEFLALCKGNVSDSVFEKLDTLTLDSNDGALLKEWSSFYSIVKEELAYQRCTKLGRSCKLPEFRNSKVTTAVSAAVNHANPLAAEEILLRLEFDLLDELVGSHNFDEWSLYGYGLKLKLLERRNVFDQVAGKEEFQSLLEDLRQQVFSM